MKQSNIMALALKLALVVLFLPRARLIKPYLLNGIIALM